MKPLWTFSSRVPVRRSQELLALASFGEVLDRVASASIEFVKIQPRTEPPLDRARAFFKVHVTEADYDAFFNSPVGYRAQYCIGIRNGEERNRELVSALTTNCLALVQASDRQSAARAEFVAASLAGTRAKIWISEADLDGLDGIHIEYEPWVAKHQAATTGTLADQAARSAASNGVLAPIGKVLELKGGWITPDGTEWLDPIKANRSYQIRDYGFS